MTWKPPVEGRYEVGSQDSPVAVCTMATMELDLPMDQIAIKGKCVTENMGIEKIIRNMIANPKLRFLLLCGQVSRGHFIEDAFLNLHKNGVDKEKRIIGAKGGMPILKNLSPEEIERFRKQVDPVNMAGETDQGKILGKVKELVGRNPGPFQGEALVREEKEEEVETHLAEPHPPELWVRDPEGYFIIRPDLEKKIIFVDHMSNNDRVIRRIHGKRAEDLYHYIIMKGWLTRKDHAAYLGRELAKAEQAIRHGMGYVQDEHLIPKKQEKPRDPNMEMRKRTLTIAGDKTITVTEPFRKEDEEFEKTMENLNLPKRKY